MKKYVYPSEISGTIAAPAFAKIATKVAAYMKLEPTEPITTPLAKITNQ